MSHQDSAHEPPAFPADPFAGAPTQPGNSDGSPLAADRVGGSRRGVIGALVAVVGVLAVVVAVLLGQALSRGGTSAAPAAGPGGGAPAAAAATPTVRATAETPRATTAPPPPTQATTGPVPAGATGFGGPMVLNPGAPAGVPTLDLFEDPQCPICKQFEAIFGSAITELVKNNEAKVVVHTMTFLDLNLRNDSSVRAANGAFCAADQGKFHDYMSAVYAAQPAQEGAGWTDAQLGGLAQQVGITGTGLDTWKACQQGLTYAAHISALETNSERSGVTGTPTALLNGTAMKLSGLDAAGFRAAVKAGAR